ncbi:MAG: MmcQ/YjbR family DNA-binding protein, partial [Candidatus Obscuribacterales bacterium]|nr:MmcQ/YjbR family DNA-binding protein [Candidatus Obscuribacterales bacterium]
YWHRYEIPEYAVILQVKPAASRFSKSEKPSGHASAKEAAISKNSSSSKAGSTKSSSTKSSSSKVLSTKEFVTRLREFALSLPESCEENPWGHPAFKVKNKTFAWLSFQEDGITLTVKLTNSRLYAEDLPFTEPCGYGLGQHGWITARFNPEDQKMSLDLAIRWIDESYRAVAPKSILKTMPASSNEFLGVEVKRIKKQTK